MGCKSSFTNGDGLCEQENHCGRYVPDVADRKVDVDFTEYPLSPIRSSGSYQIEKRDGIAVMYPSLGISADPVSGTFPNDGGQCGKVFKVAPCELFDRLVFDYVPTELSFDLGFSDRYFAYLYDTSDDAGHVGIACYYLQQRNQSTTTASPGNDPVTGDPIPGTTTTEGDMICKPCTSFSCAAAKTTISYSGVENITGDPDAPHPTLFAIGTDTNKIAFSYDNRSSTTTNACLDFEFSYDGVTYQDAWNEGDLVGTDYDSPQNPFVTGQNQLNDFQVFELDSGNQLGLRLKIAIRSIADVDAEPGPTYSGIRWTITEVMSAGQGYSVGTVFPLTYAYTKPDQSVVNLTMNLKIKTVGDLESVAGGSNLGVIQKGDTINGHVVTRVFHTDLDNFPFHVVYLNGSGNAFTKDTQYTSNSGHTITVKAGKGIVDRAILVGNYEFLDKSIQFCTADLDQTAPDVFNTLRQPDVDVTINESTGQVTSVSINDGGSGWDTLKRDPILAVVADQRPQEFGSEPPHQAEFEPTFINGVLTAVKILNPGSGYLPYIQVNRNDTAAFQQETSGLDEDQIVRTTPKLYIKNVHQDRVIKENDPAYQPQVATDLNKTLTEGAIKLPKATQDEITTAFNPPEIRTHAAVDPSLRLKLDNNRYRSEVLPQRMFSEEKTDEWKEFNAKKYDITAQVNSIALPDLDKQVIIDANELDKVQIDNFAGVMTQKVIPEQAVYRESLIETVQGPFSELPSASTYTKYIIRQYRPDPSRDITLNITLSCEVAQKGCDHVPCAPISEVGGTTTNEDGSTTTTTFTPLVGPLGGGCRDWSASGKLIIQNDLTASTNTIASAIDAYGNPFFNDV
ncbi:hypothetical protein LIS111010_083 [Synechococcus phage S-RIM2]|uniref:Uncharacterized protein n=1 Tax=Synechococcus phage S-RIM2 TaxID=687800 RepID=A0A1D7RCI1_9CAUD|nr:hypothetical protein LIS111010_083 [Synechococcus phage S-RIM2]